MSRGIQRARVDANHGEIVAALRKAGVSVFSTAAVGKGFPDLVCGLGGRNILLECKDGSLSPGRRKLSADEQEFHDAWNGSVFVVTSVDEAINVVYRECA